MRDNIHPAGTMTPWGPSQDARVVAPGITFHSTASHGGYHLSPERYAQMPEGFKETFAGGPWYEEDCDAAMVILVFEDELGDISGLAAACHDIVRRFRPDAYRQFMEAKQEGVLNHA